MPTEEREGLGGPALLSGVQQKDSSHSILTLFSEKNSPEKESEFLPRGFIREKAKAQYFHQEEKNYLSEAQ